MVFFEPGRDSEHYLGLQALYNELDDLGQAEFLGRQKRPELKVENGSEIFKEWVYAARALVSHLRDRHAFPQALADAIGTEEARDSCSQKQDDNEPYLALLAAKYLLSYQVLMSTFGKDNKAAYDASGVHSNLMEAYPNFLRFGYAPLNETMQLIPPPPTY